MAGFFSSSIGRKFMMALTGFFLMIFLVVHLGLNLTLFFGDKDSLGNILPNEEIIFNQACHFMATNPIIQVMQWVLAAGFLYHILLGIVLTIQNRRARGNDRYAVNKYSANTPFASRTMIYSGILILLFLAIHMYHYLVPIQITGVEGRGAASDYHLVVNSFKDVWFTILYLVAFILLGLHLSHGFASAFQSTGVNHRTYNPWIKRVGIAYFAFMTLGFIFIAIYFCLKGNGVI